MAKRKKERSPRARPLTRAEQNKGEPDNRPWFDRATDSQFLDLDPGGHTLLVAGEARERVNNFGNPVVDIPTRQGIFSTAAYAILRPLAQYLKDKKKITGAVLTFTATGEEAARRYEDVVVK